MTADMLGSHPLQTDAGSNFSVGAFPTRRDYEHSRDIVGEYTYLRLNVGDAISREAEFIQWDLRLFQIPQESQLALEEEK
jgi:hypothetical protein